MLCLQNELGLIEIAEEVWPVGAAAGVSHVTEAAAGLQEVLREIDLELDLKSLPLEMSKESEV
jgi:hypothetical protein